MGSIFSFLNPAPYKEELQDQNQIQKDYKYWRIRVFYSMFIGYAFYYLTRKCIAFCTPTMMTDLGLTKAEVGILASIWAVSYGTSKFVSGVLGDRSNARTFMGFGLIITGICNILFGMSSSMLVFSILWGLNGWFQGFGWPSCARLLLHWYSQGERGRWWSAWNTSQNISGALIPLFTAFIAQYYGWRYAMAFPGVLGIGMGFLLINRLCDTPQSMGLPPIEKYRNDYPSKPSKEKEHELSVKEILFTHVLNNPYIWILAISYYFVYVVRMSTETWTVLYLVEAQKYSQLGAGSVYIWFDIGGIFGSLAAGWMSDKIFTGRRAPVCVIFSLLISIIPLAFILLGTITPLLYSFLLFATGFFIYGPQMLIGMAAAELSHKKAAATASGFTGCVAYLGAATAGYPLGKIAELFGWTGLYTALCSASLISALLMIPLWKMRTRPEKTLPVDEPKKNLATQILDITPKTSS